MSHTTVAESVTGHYPAGIGGFRSGLSALTSSPNCDGWSSGEILQDEAMRLPHVRFTVRRMMVAVAVVAVALSVQGAIISIALLVLVHVVRRPHPVPRTTAILLTLITGIFLWANLRLTGYEEFGGLPDELDPITKEMFWRGWPLSPCMICEYRRMSFHPSGIEGCALVFDGILFLFALFATRTVSERCLRWLQHRNL
jgi:hypothetical protein